MVVETLFCYLALIYRATNYPALNYIIMERRTKGLQFCFKFSVSANFAIIRERRTKGLQFYLKFSVSANFANFLRKNSIIKSVLLISKSSESHEV